MRTANRPSVSCQYRCLWQQCSFLSQNVLVYYRHVDGHWREASGIDNDGDDNEASATFHCHWRACIFSTCDRRHLCRHVLYHGYHHRLVQLGSLAVRRKRAPPCLLPPPISVVPDLSQPFICLWESCCLELDEPATFFAHVQHHLTMEERDARESETRAVCLWQECDRRLSNTEMARFHAHVHSGERVAACDGCGREFSGAAWLLQHRWRQASEARRRWQCSRCSCRFGSQHLLMRHLKKHTPPAQCHFCGLWYCEALLDAHIRWVHTNVAKYTCTVCSAKFKYRSVLRAHARQHDPDCERHRCPHAGCSFRHRLRSMVRYHVAQRHEGRRRIFACHRCPAEFSAAAALTRHLRRFQPRDLPPNVRRVRYTRRAGGRYSLRELEEKDTAAPEESRDDVLVSGVVCVRGGAEGSTVPVSVTMPDGRCCCLPEPVRRLLAEGFDVLLAPAGPDRRRLRLLSVTCGLELEPEGDDGGLLLQVDAVQAEMMGVAPPPATAAPAQARP